MTRHKHADLIHAYADGAEIESWNGQRWVVDKAPCFLPELGYRIKPRVVRKEGWVNIYPGKQRPLAGHEVYPTEKAAQLSAAEGCVAHAKIVWEEEE